MVSTLLQGGGSFLPAGPPFEQGRLSAQFPGFLPTGPLTGIAPFEVRAALDPTLLPYHVAPKA